MKKINIGQRFIDKEEPCFVVAEAGSNHNGSIEQAKRMIDVAADSGADAVKFQVFRVKTMYPNKPIDVKYLKNMGIEEDLYSIIKRYEMPYEWLDELCGYAKKRDINFMATPFDVEGVKILNPYVSVYKIASYEALYGDLIEAVKRTGKPVFISLGGCSEREVDLLMEKLLYDYVDKTVLLHCIAKYPAPLNQINLKVIPYLSEKYNVHVGYSDHTAEPLTAPMIAVGLGAKVIEKHFTLSKMLPGPDHAFALEPDELKDMIEAIRATEITIKDYQMRKSIQPCEKELYYYKRCLYYKKDLPKGHMLSRSDVLVLRNTGTKCHYFNPLEIDMVVGKSLRKNKRAAEIVLKEDLN
jgi:N,N'-diacetyllegionaminate synthase